MTKQEELDKVKQRILDEMVCPLKDAAQSLVFGKGNPDAPIMFIGEAPGAKEDEQGIPFVGKAGKQLDEFLHSIGLTLDGCYIANILKYRPPKNRDPTPEEIARHTPYLIEQIKIINPKIIATLGNFSSKFVLAKFDITGMKRIPGVSSLHGSSTSIEVDDLRFAVVPLYHPAAMIYRRSLKETLEEDFVKMGKWLAEHYPDEFSLDSIEDQSAVKERPTQLTDF